METQAQESVQKGGRSSFAAADTSFQQEILGLEKKYWQALKDNDMETALRLTDDQGIVTGAQGVSRIDRSTFETMMRQAPYKLNDFSIGDDVEVSQLSDDIGIIAYKAHGDYTVDGESVGLDIVDSSVWVRRNGNWVCVLHTESIVGDPFGRDRRHQ